MSILSSLPPAVLTNFSSFHTPAQARHMLELKTENDIPTLLAVAKECQEGHVPMVILGGGTNVLLAFDEYPGCVVINHMRGWELEDENTLYVESGANVTAVATVLNTKHQNPTLTPWLGLPGTFGGAIFGNAGCFGLETVDICIDVKTVNLLTGEYQTLAAKDLEFEYRSSIFKKANPYTFIVSARFRVVPSAAVLASDTQTKRTWSQPRGFTCGSFFKNPKPLFAGKLIEDAGLKGFAIGGVRVSEVHANFFMNDGTATYQDILALKDHVQKTVYAQFGVELESEVRIIGSDTSIFL